MPQNVEVKETLNKGKGVFALRDFEKDEFILYIGGKVVETDHPDSFPKDVQDHWYPIGLENGKRRYVLPRSPWMYLNHSCEPNAGIKNNKNIVAMKFIKKGEEILIDYTMNNIDAWTMKCKCGSKNCRRIISTFDKLDERTQIKYKDYVADVVKEKFF